ncbi:MAG TPA: hypothetical protein VFU43_28980 [Streptosporangiaceae bacterium]|nr:hypothetical protein [Streptosporangiaceae bacterium]
MNDKRRRWLGAGPLCAIVVAAFALALGMPGQAQAAPAGDDLGSMRKLTVRSPQEVQAMAARGEGTLLTIPRGAAARKGARSDASAAAAADIICVLDVSEPFGGGHPANPVLAEGIVVCSDFVDFITLRVELFRDNTRVAADEFTVPLIPGLLVRTGAACAPGSYLAIAQASVVVFAADPPIASNIVGSGRVDITCGVSIPPPPNCEIDPRLCAVTDGSRPATATRSDEATAYAAAR